MRLKNQFLPTTGTWICTELSNITLPSTFMHNEFEAIIERDGEWYAAYSPEMPGANGQGRTVAEARESLAGAIELILEDRREDAHRGLPSDALVDTVSIG
jgi:predicted RNase H-like HicB family nuclease